MTTFVNDDGYRECVNCSIPMRKMPYVTGIYMCERCSGFEYRIPAEWGMTEEEDESKQDEALYRIEIGGE